MPAWSRARTMTTYVPAATRRPSTVPSHSQLARVVGELDGRVEDRARRPHVGAVDEDLLARGRAPGSARAPGSPSARGSSSGPRQLVLLRADRRHDARPAASCPCRCCAAASPRGPGGAGSGGCGRCRRAPSGRGRRVPSQTRRIALARRAAGGRASTRTSSPSRSMTVAVTSSVRLRMNETRVRSKRPSRLGEKNAVARESWTRGGVLLSSWATKNAANVAHDEQREGDPRRRRSRRCSAPGRASGDTARSCRPRRSGTDRCPSTARIVPPWVTTSAGSGPAATSASAAATRARLLGDGLAAGKAKRGSAARQRVVAPALARRRCRRSGGPSSRPASASTRRSSRTGSRPSAAPTIRAVSCARSSGLEYSAPQTLVAQRARERARLLAAAIVQPRVEPALEAVGRVVVGLPVAHEQNLVRRPGHRGRALWASSF